MHCTQMDATEDSVLEEKTASRASAPKDRNLTLIVSAENHL